MPKVSVIMGVYNASQYVEEAIRSIIGQSYENMEFIICDDGSIDGTIDIVRNMVKIDDRIIVIENGENKGLGFSLNRCIDKARGDYLVRMDGDDLSTVYRIEKLVNTAAKNTDYAVIGTGMVLFDDNGDWGRILPIEFPSKIQVFKGPAVAHATTIMKTDIIRKIGAYNPACDSCHAEDYDMWCRLIEANYLIMSIPDLLYKCRWDKTKYYQRRKVSYLLGFTKLKFYWCKRFKLGLTGWIHCGVTLLKAITPAFLKRVYHKVIHKHNN